MNRKELIKKYIEFFKSKNHKEIQNSSLIPENDPTVLFTTAGMHPLVPFLLGQPHPLGKRLCNVQRCIRTGDIDCVGDETHHTFFEMLGNWSLGDYFKKEAIEFSFEFLTKVLKIPKERLSVTCFNGEKNIPKDEGAEKIWKALGINKIKFLGKEDNWWGPAGKTGPCGPDTEMFVNNIEIWNDVFMEYNKIVKDLKKITNKKELEDLTKKGYEIECIINEGKSETYQVVNYQYISSTQKNVDTGMGVERTLAILNNFDDNYLSEVWQPIIKEIEKLSKRKYEDYKKEMRIIADHIKAAVFIIADGITPGNSEQGYVLRRLIRRTIVQGRKLEIKNFVNKIAEPVFEIYNDYEHLQKNKNKILEELEKEENKFLETLEKGIELAMKIARKNMTLSGKDSFLLYQSYGIPPDVIDEIVEEIGSNIDKEEFQKEFQKHQELSRTASAGKFKSGLADNSEATTKLHTATHLLLAALKIILKDETIEQRGANITPERLRFDFTFPRKLTEEEIKKIEELVNAQIQKSCEVIREEMSPQEAKTKGACGIFDKKYGEKVSVYTIGNFSKEICTGPHVKNTCEIGKFKITKEESSSSGIRRIKAIVN
jgi:alanyl-tRNA synthetase